MAGATDGRLVTLSLDRHGLGPTPVGDPQEDASPPDLKERPGLAPGDLLKDREILGSDREGVVFGHAWGELLLK